MTRRTPLRLAPDPLQLHFGAQGQLRQALGDTGRAHLDRDLPFLVLHRSDDPDQSLARRIALNASAYLVWSPADDGLAAMALEQIADRAADRSGRLLLISIADSPPEPRPSHASRLPPFLFTTGAAKDEGARRAGQALDKALAAIRIDLRKPKVEPADAPAMPAIVTRLFDKTAPVDCLSLSIPPIHLAADGRAYPQLSHDLAVAVGDALLRSACAYLDDGSGRAPAHYRALGRSAFLAAALKIDRRLDEIAGSFDFLLSVSPINTAHAATRFLESRGREAPRFRYRPLTVDPDSAKRDLYAIDLSRLEDPLLETLFAEKRREIDMQLTMLATRNTPSFRPASMMFYGAPTTELVSDAVAILAQPERDPPRGQMADAPVIAAAAEALIARYRAADDRFTATVEQRDDVTGLVVSNGRLMIGADSLMPKRRLDALLSHEVSVHLLTWCNGATQGLGIFRTGLAHYEGIQEGLGVFGEWAVGGLTRTRLRLLAGRVVAVDAMLAGAAFAEVFSVLRNRHGFTDRGAFGIAARVFRSGGFAKDAIYLQGLRDIMVHVAAGKPLDPYWLGKIAPVHLGAVDELLQRGLLHPPPFRPEFLAREDTRARLARWQANPDFDRLLEPGVSA